jgi:hypothetical protein
VIGAQQENITVNKMTGIDATKLLQLCKAQKKRIGDLTTDNERLQAENAELRRQITRESEAAPHRKNAQNYLKKLARCRRMVETGELTTLGRSAIKTKIGCGDKTAGAIQVDLVGEGLAYYTGGGHIKIGRAA